ncbi:hypothetical protein VOLCADRAFT_98158 [Volvox carteri f. nagariensis]|uniref:Uncharacterized protein n=1 Tax=Volvox carteri f. nagariensis TaxID=3068 RepID=D8UEL4_VOLCA|nr:uncharacterized protein VOLCADRAFT_98158 [Volvox carteri f. nagariensis]EFJ41903.1 hypothetical protein VOLCADRAFT_98158 [Volvox carteri f. nagariensis]|eukprot:XP_002957101.1 hypothetical protein VOLCADRAFT_98158 [Volvox carteri f. nagariensis]
MTSVSAMLCVGNGSASLTCFVGSRGPLAIRAQAMQAAQAVGGLIHVSETWIMAGSAALALSVPVAFGAVRQGRVQSVTPGDALVLLKTGGNVKLVDVRSRLEVKIEGLPLKRAARKAKVIHAPFNELRGGKLQPSPSFLDDILFAPGVDHETTFIVLSSRGSETCRRAAKAVPPSAIVAGLDTEATGVFGEDSSADDEEDYYGDLYDMKARGDAASGGARRGVEEVFLDSADSRGLLGMLLRVPFKPKLLEVLKQGVRGRVWYREGCKRSQCVRRKSFPRTNPAVYTVVVGGFLASALSGSRVTVVGPTAAFIPIVAGVAHAHGAAGLVACTGLAGLMLVAMGATGLGGIIRVIGSHSPRQLWTYVPKPVVTGFTAGIATYIFGTQIKDFLGLGAPGRLPEGVPVPTEFLEKVVYLGSHLDAAHVPSVAMALGCLVLIKTWPKEWGKVVPTPIVAIAAGTLGLQLLQLLQPGVDLGIETIGSHFGEGAIPRSLPSLQWPQGLSASDLPGLLYPSATIAMLAAIESLLCARVADTMIGDKHDSNTELISQVGWGGVANIRAGGRSPVSGLVHAAAVAAVILAAAPLAEYIPLPALSAVLVVVALNMGEWHNFQQLPKWPENDAHLFLIAFSLTVLQLETLISLCYKFHRLISPGLQDVAVAVAFGMVIALAVFVQDVSATMYVRALPPRSVVTPPYVDPSTALLDSDGAADDEPYRRRTAPVRRGSSGEEEEDPVEGPLPSVATSSSSSALVATGGSSGGLLAAGGPLGCVVPPGTVYVEVTGSLLFGAGEVLERAVEAEGEATPSREAIQVLVLNMSHVSVVDVSGLELLEEVHRRLWEAGKTLVLCGLTRQPLRMMARAGFLDETKDPTPPPPRLGAAPPHLLPPVTPLTPAYFPSFLKGWSGERVSQR